MHIAYLPQKTPNRLYREKRPPTKNRKHVLKQDELMKKSVFKHCRKSLQVDCWFVLELYVSPFVRFIFIFPCQQLLADKVCSYYCDANFFLCWACQKFIVQSWSHLCFFFSFILYNIFFFLSQLEWVHTPNGDFWKLQEITHRICSHEIQANSSSSCGYHKNKRAILIRFRTRPPWLSTKTSYCSKTLLSSNWTIKTLIWILSKL